MATKFRDELSELMREKALPKVIEDVFKEHNFVWNKLEKDRSWTNGVEYQIPWELAEADNHEFGGLVDEDDIGEGLYAKPKIYDQAELWSTLDFHEKDLDRHKGNMEDSFLDILPSKLKKMTRRTKAIISAALIRGGSIGVAETDGNASGELTVDRPQLLTIGMKVLIKDSASQTTGYVRKIHIQSRKITIFDARKAGAAVDLSAFTVAQGAGLYVVGADTENFFTFQDYLLPASEGGKDEVYESRFKKDDFPLLQPMVFDGGASGMNITASNVLDKLYDLYFDAKEYGKIESGELLVPYHIFKACAKKLQSNKQYHNGEAMAGVGFDTITIMGGRGAMKLTALDILRNDQMMMINWEDFFFAGDKFFDRKRQLDGREYYTIRKKTGYVHIVDSVFRGNLLCKKLSSSLIVHSVPKL